MSDNNTVSFNDVDFSNMLDRLNELNDINYLELSMSSQIMGLKLIIKDARRQVTKFLDSHKIWLVQRLEKCDKNFKFGYNEIVNLVVQKFEYDLNNIISMICENFSKETVENLKQNRSGSDTYSAMSFLNAYFETCDRSILDFMIKNSKDIEEGSLYYKDTNSLNDIIMELIDDEIERNCKYEVSSKEREVYYCNNGMILEKNDPDVHLIDEHPEEMIIDENGNVREKNDLCFCNNDESPDTKEFEEKSNGISW